ncbi:hypothetical protein DPMN_161405 [Dreissena polymorpha]|uniref:Uncharacterized protein n=1 Tax=Dreissena polymorpha TaxID=45954 RepID=A0A9D4ET32_DREPO|nr:hypothetical protein DPMN_161405 [Dreissena polymorpha]
MHEHLCTSFSKTLGCRCSDARTSVYILQQDAWMSLLRCTNICVHPSARRLDAAAQMHEHLCTSFSKTLGCRCSDARTSVYILQQDAWMPLLRCTNICVHPSARRLDVAAQMMTSLCFFPSEGSSNVAAGTIKADDDEPVFLSQRGVIKCRSGDHQGELCCWGWNCESEYHKGKYNDNTVDNDCEGYCEGYIFALSMAVQLVGTMGSEWAAELISRIQEDVAEQQQGRYVKMAGFNVENRNTWQKYKKGDMAGLNVANRNTWQKYKKGDMCWLWEHDRKTTMAICDGGGVEGRKQENVAEKHQWRYVMVAGLKKKTTRAICDDGGVESRKQENVEGRKQENVAEKQQRRNVMVAGLKYVTEKQQWRYVIVAGLKVAYMSTWQKKNNGDM